MKNKIYSHLPAIIFGVLVVSFLAAFYIFAWTEPTTTPPGGNVPAPINVSSVDQIKQGSLSLNIAGISPTGLIVNRDAIFLNGNVGIGTTGPGYKLDVAGITNVRDRLTFATNYNQTHISMQSAGSQWGQISSPAANVWTLGYAGSNTSTPGTAVLTWNLGNVGIGTTNPGERLDLGGGNIAMGYQVVINDCNVSVAANLGQMCYVYCPAGKRVISGGCWILDTPGNTSGTLQNSHPIDNNTGWACAYSNIRIDPGVMRVEAICANMR